MARSNIGGANYLGLAKERVRHVSQAEAVILVNEHAQQHHWQPIRLNFFLTCINDYHTQRVTLSDNGGKTVVLVVNYN